MMYEWCMMCVFMYDVCMNDVCVVCVMCVWCMCDVCMCDVLWCMYGVCMTYVWYMYVCMCICFFKYHNLFKSSQTLSTFLPSSAFWPAYMPSLWETLGLRPVLWGEQVSFRATALSLTLCSPIHLMGDVSPCCTGLHHRPLFLPKVATGESLPSPIRDREQCPLTVRANTRDHTLS